MALFGRLVERVERRAEEVASNRLSMVEKAVANIPGSNSRREDWWMAVSGRDLVKRWLDEAWLRFALRGLR